MLALETFNKLLRPEFHIFCRSWPSFHLCGLTGLAFAVSLVLALVAPRSLSPWIMLGISLTAVLTFLGLTLAVKVITGKETLVYYHHEIAVMVVCGLTLWLLRQPVLAYLDTTILGIGTFLAFGRIGCLMVGCCYGKPHTWGVCYHEEHARAGVPSYLVGVRLFPSQAVESLWALGVVIVGSVLVWLGQPPGAALAWFVIMHDLGRFCLEFMRGDVGRPELWGFSEAQWIALGLTGLVVGAEFSGLLPFYGWHLAALIGLVTAMIAIAISRLLRRTPTHQLLHPRHVHEVAQAMVEGSNPPIRRMAVAGLEIAPPPLKIGRTSLGIQISSSQVKTPTGMIHHFTLSQVAGRLTPSTARVLADLILKLQRRAGKSQLVEAKPGLFHLLIFHGRLDLKKQSRLAFNSVSIEEMRQRHGI